MNLLLMGSECDLFLWSSWISGNEYDMFGWWDQLIQFLTCKSCMCTHYYTRVMFVSIKVKVSVELLTVYETVLLPWLPCCTDPNSPRPHHRGAPYREIVWRCEKNWFAPGTCFRSANIWLFCTARLLLWSKQNTISAEPYTHARTCTHTHTRATHTHTHANSHHSHTHTRHITTYTHACTHTHTHINRFKIKGAIKIICHSV